MPVTQPKADMVTLVIGEATRFGQSNLVSVLKPIQPMPPTSKTKRNLQGAKGAKIPMQSGTILMYTYITSFCENGNKVMCILYNTSLEAATDVSKFCNSGQNT